MRVAVLVSSRKKAGPVIVAKDQIDMLMKKGHSCDLFYFDECANELKFSCSCKKISLKTSIDFSQYDIVHCHGGRPCFFVTIRKPFFCKTKFITTIHNYIFQDFYYTYGLCTGFVQAIIFLFFTLRFDKIIVLSKDAIKYYKRFLFFKNFDFLYNSVDYTTSSLIDNSLNELLDFKGKETLLGIHAVLSKGKGQHIAIAALPKLPHCKLFLLGSGTAEKELKNLAEELGVSDRVYFAGFRKNAVDYLPYYDLFLLPSYSEGCPLALLEAMAAGKKIVCSDISVHKELFDDSGIEFFNIKEPSSLVEAIQRALALSDVEKKLKKHFAEKFSSEVIYSRLIEIYNK